MKDTLKLYGGVAGIILLGVGLFIGNLALNGLIIMLLWNWIAVKFGLIAVSFLEAVGLWLLVQLLFPRGTYNVSNKK